MNERPSYKPLNRILAKFIDLFIVMMLAAIVIYPLGPLLGFLYSVLGDSLPLKGFTGQSIGKKIFQLQVFSLKTGMPLTLRESLLRNTPVGVATFFALIPVWGWVILAIVGFPLMIIEIYLLVKAPGGQRLGDVMADTLVRQERDAPLKIKSV